MTLATVDTGNASLAKLCGIKSARKVSGGAELTFSPDFSGGVNTHRANDYQSLPRRYAVSEGKMRAYKMPQPGKQEFEGPDLTTLIVKRSEVADIGSKDIESCQARQADQDGTSGITLDIFTDVVRDGKPVVREQTSFIPFQ